MKLSYKIALLASRLATSEAWKTYKKEHPNTKKTEQDFLEEEESLDVDDILDKDDDDVTDHLVEVDPPKKDEVKKHDLDPGIDPTILNKSLDEILGKKEKKDIGEKLEDVAEKIVNVLDFDEFVQNLPDKAKNLAQHLRDTQKKNEESAEKIMEEKPHIKYEDYTKEMKKRKDPVLPKSDWESLAKKLKDKADKEKKREEAERKKKEKEDSEDK